MAILGVGSSSVKSTLNFTSRPPATGEVGEIGRLAGVQPHCRGNISRSLRTDWQPWSVFVVPVGWWRGLTRTRMSSGTEQAGELCFTTCAFMFHARSSFRWSVLDGCFWSHRDQKTTKISLISLLSQQHTGGSQHSFVVVLWIYHHDGVWPRREGRPTKR